MPPIVLAKRDTCFVKSHYVEIFENRVIPLQVG